MKLTLFTEVTTGNIPTPIRPFQGVQHNRKKLARKLQSCVTRNVKSY